MIMKISTTTWMLPSKRIIGLRESLISKGDNKGNRTCSRPSGWTLLSQQGCIGSDLTPMDFDTGKFLRVLHFSMLFIEPNVLFQCWALGINVYMYIVSCVGHWLYVKLILTPFLYITLLNTGMTCTFIPIVFAFTIWVYLVYDDSEYIHDIRIFLEDDHYRIYIYIPYCRNHTMF